VRGCLDMVLIRVVVGGNAKIRDFEEIRLDFCPHTVQGCVYNTTAVNGVACMI
jgi:hypothetical protein